VVFGLLAYKTRLRGIIVAITGLGVVVTGSEVAAGFVLIISGGIIAWRVLRVISLISKEGFGIGLLFALVCGNG
jgi:hypothetical protein